MSDQTRRFLGGRQPLCGMGVRSLMDRTSIPAVESARMADSRPAPGPLTRTSTVRRPDSFALFAAVRDACCAANGVPLREPRKPSEPELDQAITLPIGSVNVMIVLLNVACTWQRPMGTFFLSFFLKAFFFAFFAGALAMFVYWCGPLLLARLLLVGDSTLARAFPRTGIRVGALTTGREAAAMAQSAIRTHLDQTLDV